MSEVGKCRNNSKWKNEDFVCIRERLKKKKNYNNKEK